VFCEWELYDGTAPEQKTKSAKNGLDSMSKPFFHNPSECNQLHPPPFAMEAKRLIYFYSARFSHFIDSLTADTHAGGFDNIMHIKSGVFLFFMALDKL